MNNENLDLITQNTKGSAIINIPKGPRFQPVGGAFWGIIFLLFLIFSIAFIIHAEYVLFIIFFLITIASFIYTIDIRGIEVNKEKHIIREYKLFFWLKLGKWESMEKYKTLYLVHETAKGINSGPLVHQKSATFHYYIIKLVNEAEHKEIVLAEYNNYHKAEKISSNIARATGIEYKAFKKNKGKGARQ